VQWRAATLSPIIPAAGGQAASLKPHEPGASGIDLLVNPRAGVDKALLRGVIALLGAVFYFVPG